MKGDTRRETVTSLAKRLGLHHSTVSRSLRNDPAISSETRQRVIDEARASGYQPDPKLRALMRQVRQAGVEQAPSESVAVFCPSSLELTAQRQAYIACVKTGMQAEAERHGLRVEVFLEGREGLTGRRIQTILDARGIRGLVILPPDRDDYTPPLALERFATVAMGLDTLEDLPLHRVCFDAYRCMDECLGTLAGRGHKRVALVLTGLPFVCASARYHAAGLLAARRHGLELKVFEHFQEASFTEYRDGIAAFRPDAILADTPDKLRGFTTAPFPIRGGLERYAIGRPANGFSGYAIDLEEVGRLAVRRIATELQENRIGYPDTPASMLVTGRWSEHALDEAS